MKSRSVARAVVIVLGVALGGCAVADEDPLAVAPKGRIDARARDTQEPNDDDTGTTPEPDSASSDDTSGSDASGGDSGSSDDSADTGGGGGESGSPCATLSSTECASSAELLTSISGDEGGTATASGTDSKFLRIRVTENDSSAFSSKDLRARITLRSTGANFDLYAYMGRTQGDGGGFECMTVKSSSTNPLGTNDVVALSWNDNRPFGGHDDTRTISIEVRGADPSCAGASWTLTVEGNK